MNTARAHQQTRAVRIGDNIQGLILTAPQVDTRARARRIVAQILAGDLKKQLVIVRPKGWQSIEQALDFVTKLRDLQISHKGNLFVLEIVLPNQEREANDDSNGSLSKAQLLALIFHANGSVPQGQQFGLPTIVLESAISDIGRLGPLSVSKALPTKSIGLHGRCRWGLPRKKGAPCVIIKEQSGNTKVVGRISSGSSSRASGTQQRGIIIECTLKDLESNIIDV